MACLYTHPSKARQSGLFSAYQVHSALHSQVRKWLLGRLRWLRHQHEGPGHQQEFVPRIKSIAITVLHLCTLFECLYVTIMFNQPFTGCFIYFIKLSSSSIKAHQYKLSGILKVQIGCVLQWQGRIWSWTAEPAFPYFRISLIYSNLWMVLSKNSVYFICKVPVIGSLV